MSMFIFCISNTCKLLIIKTNSKMEEMFAYWRLHKERFQPIIKAELSEICKDFEMKQKRIKNTSDWLYE